MKRSVLFLTIIIVMFSCSKNPANNDDSDERNPATKSEFVSADSGVTIKTDSGISLTIPAYALPADTLITVSEIVPDSEDEITLAGLKFEPNGIVLNKPAIISVPFDPPVNWTEGELIPIYDFKGDDPTMAAWTGYYAQIVHEDGMYVAKGFTTHFSGKLFVRNCHSGTMDYIINQFNKKGCHPDTVMTLIRDKYSGENIQDYNTEKVDERSIQRLFSTFFVEKYTYDRGAGVPAQVLSELSEYTRDGRIVVAAFTPSQWSEKNADGLYPRFAHTAVFEEKNGQIQIRNSANVRPNPKLIQALGGTNIIYYPVEKLNEFRELQAGVAVELAAGVGPDGFSSLEKNSWGLDLYNPVDGKNWTGIAWEDPSAFLSSLLSGNFSSISGIPPRPRPWTAVKIYVQKAAGYDNPCETDYSMIVNVSIDGYVTTIKHKKVAGTTLFTTGMNVWWTEEGEDLLSIYFNKNLTAGQTYTDVGKILSGEANFLFKSPQIRHNDDPDKFSVGFWSKEGSITIEEFGTSNGDRIKGTFDITVEGDKFEYDPVLDASPLITVEGTISGSFDFLYDVQ